jgi:hypothetical protein
MKTQLIAAAFAVVSCGLLRAETVTLTLSPVVPLPSGATIKAQSATVTLAAGDIAELVSAPLPDEKEFPLAPRRLIHFETGGQTYQCQTVVTPAGWDAESGERAYAGMPKVQSFKVSGPGTFKLVSGYSDTKGFATFAVTRATAVPAVTPANAVVIPSDANGNFQVILESSTDLVTWTAATPGTYSSTTEKRFFRSRIVQQ